MAAAVGKRPRQLLALRAIVVSGRAALLKTPTAKGRQGVTARVAALLAELEESLRRDGAPADVLARLEDARREFGDGAPPHGIVDN